MDHLKKELSNPAVVVFGSYSRGEDVEDSDIDLYIETPSKRRPSVEMFKKMLERDIQIFQHKNIREIANPGLANNIVNGVTLNSHMEVFS